MTNLETPKAAAQFIEEAKEHGFDVKTSVGETYFEVYVEKEYEGSDKSHKVSAGVTWSVKNVAGMNSRLGFATSYTRGVRFDFASTHYHGYDSQAGRMGWIHGSPRSLRHVKIDIGIPV